MRARTLQLNFELEDSVTDDEFLQAFVQIKEEFLQMLMDRLLIGFVQTYNL